MTVSEELFQRIKAHLERESARMGRKFARREFVLSLIEEALLNPPLTPFRRGEAR